MKTITWKTAEWPLQKFLATKKAKFNPKAAEPEEIAKLAEDYRVFGIGRSFAARSDGLLLDGHQSQLAIELLLHGEAKKPWTPPATVSMRIAKGMSDTVARAFIAAVSARKVEPDELLYGKLLLDITERVKSAPEDDRAFYEQAVGAIGLERDELADYLELATFVPPESGGAPHARGNPKITLEFSSVWLRDAVKTAIGEAAEKLDTDVPGGNALAKLLGIERPGKKQKKRARA